MNTRTRAALDAIAALYEGGHLLLATEPDVLLNQAVEEIKAHRSGALRTMDSEQLRQHIREAYGAELGEDDK